jgi:hypothetical protein
MKYKKEEHNSEKFNRAKRLYVFPFSRSRIVAWF